MRAARKYVAAGAFALVFVSPATAQADLTPQGILALGKMAGACGILNSMIQFQSTTRMEGGEAFVLRFWEVEAARLGVSVQGLSDTCNQSVSAYDKLWEAAESML